MKYKLINRATNEAHMCDKVTIDGLDYYVIDEKPIPCTPVNVCMAHITKMCAKCGKYQGKKVIATNNPSIDIPKVIDEVDEAQELAYIHYKSNKHYTTRDAHHFGLGYNKSQETHPNSDEDMCNFAKFIYEDDGSCVDNDGNVKQEVLKQWKSQQPKVLYYEAN